MTELVDHPLTRRALAAATGAAAVVSTTAGAAGAASGTLRIGVLTTSGTSFRRSGSSLLDGLAVGFAVRSGGWPDVRVEHRPVPFGYVGAEAAAAELIGRGAQVVVAGVSSLAAPRLARACTAGGAALVVANVGAHVVTDRVPGTLHSSLQHWQSSLTMGQWSARRLGRTLFQIVAVPDAGYDTVYTFRRGFQQAGGSFLDRALTHQDPRDDGTRAAARAAKRSGAKVVVVSASGRRAAQIVRACRGAGVKADLVVDSLAVEPFASRALGRFGAGLHSAASWTLSGDGAINRDFVRAYWARTDRTPDAFSVLGHDTALLVAAGARRLAGGDRPWTQLPRVLAGVSVPGARGAQQVHRTLRTVSTPLAVRTTRRANGRLVNDVLVGRQRVPGVPPALAALETSEVAAYVNEYLGT